MPTRCSMRSPMPCSALSRWATSAATFPDSDPRYRDVDSRVLLRAAVALLAEKGWRPVNVDATIIAQQPRLAPHAAAMVANVAVDLGISPDSVNIKGKTNEKLGYLGREEAIEAQAVVLVERAG